MCFHKNGTSCLKSPYTTQFYYEHRTKLHTADAHTNYACSSEFFFSLPSGKQGFAKFILG